MTRVAVGLGVLECVGMMVAVAVWVGVWVGIEVSVDDRDALAVEVELMLCEGVAEAVCDTDDVGLGVLVGTTVPVPVPDGV